MVPPDFTGMLKLICIAPTASPLSVTYRCLYADKIEVALKVVVISSSFNPRERDELMQKAKHELQIWSNLNHPNIVRLLGTASGKGYGSDLPCLVSPWMENRTLFDYTNSAPFSDRVKLLNGIASGLEYCIVHGNFHPGNIFVDDNKRPQITDFALSTTLNQGLDRSPVYPGAVPWTAPELLYPELNPSLKFEATLQSDIYSFGSVIFYVVSGQYPWKNRGMAENSLKKLQNPARPVPPVNMPDGVWYFIERCWSPRNPRGRPSAQEALAFATNFRFE